MPSFSAARRAESSVAWVVRIFTKAFRGVGKCFAFGCCFGTEYSPISRVTIRACESLTVHNTGKMPISSKAIIPHRKTLPTVTSFQTDLGLVRVLASKEHGDQHFLTSTEVGRLAGLPGRWALKGYHMNLLAEKAGLVVRVNGRWDPTGEGRSHGRKVDHCWRWYPSMVDQIRRAAKEHDLDDLLKKGDRDEPN
jgi:hypothetical protein